MFPSWYVKMAITFAQTLSASLSDVQLKDSINEFLRSQHSDLSTSLRQTIVNEVRKNEYRIQIQMMLSH